MTQEILTSQVRLRDELVHDLRCAFVKHAPVFEDAFQRVDRHLAAFIEEKVAEKRRSIDQTLKLLEIAKRIVLKPAEMEADTDFVVDPDNPPDGLDPLVARPRVLKHWQVEAYEALRRYDMHVVHEVPNLVGHLKNAAGAGCDLATTSALDAYVYALSKVWAQGKYPESYFRGELDPAAAIAPGATAEMGLVALLSKALDVPLRHVREVGEWEEVAVVVCMALDPECTGAEQNMRQAMPWRRQGPDAHMMNQRSLVLDYCEMRRDLPEGDAHSPRLLSLLQLARDHCVRRIALHQLRSELRGNPPTDPLDAGRTEPIAAPRTEALPVPEQMFVQEGAAWRVRFAGSFTTIPNIRGMQYIWFLLQKPGQPIHVRDLNPEDREHVVEQALDDPVVDAEGEVGLRDRLETLNAKVDEARAKGDQQAEEYAETEIEQIERYLNSAASKGGQTRQFPNPDEQRRNRVGKAIARAIEAIEAEIPDLAVHLRGSITDRAGFAPCYHPSPPVQWMT